VYNAPSLSRLILSMGLEYEFIEGSTRKSNPLKSLPPVLEAVFQRGNNSITGGPARSPVTGVSEPSEGLVGVRVKLW